MELDEILLSPATALCDGVNTLGYWLTGDPQGIDLNTWVDDAIANPYRAYENIRDKVPQSDWEYAISVIPDEETRRQIKALLGG